MTGDRGEAPPLVGIPCCAKQVGAHPFHAVGDKYVRAVSDGAACLPMLIPALGELYDVGDLVSRVDGLLITGSPSNIEPERYGGPQSDPTTAHDPARDATTLPLIRAALDVGLPMLAICRGLQELNVALGGTLHQKVHEVPGRIDHRADDTLPLDVQYGPAHPVWLIPGGRLRRLFGVDEITVNSIHSQGVDRLAPGLAVEAVAPDGQVEAVRVDGAAAFALAVQWHPEWRFWDDTHSTRLLQAFGQAVWKRRARVRSAAPAPAPRSGMRSAAQREASRRPRTAARP